jgi:hypothetical protein
LRQNNKQSACCGIEVVQGNLAHDYKETHVVKLRSPKKRFIRFLGKKAENPFSPVIARSAKHDEAIQNKIKQSKLVNKKGCSIHHL